MEQSISREEQKVQDRQPTTKTEPSAGGLLGSIYEEFFGLPVPVVLTVLWFGGIALLGSCVLALYALATSLAQVVTGA